jgi:hypothetical protein
MTPPEMEARIVRYGELRPCRTAFIDAHTPGSDQKENFTIIGGGVSEAADQHVHIAIPTGFNIGAAGTAAEVPQLAAFAPHGRGVLRALGALALLLGALGQRGRAWCWRRAISSTSPPASSAASRISAPITG